MKRLYRRLLEQRSMTDEEFQSAVETVIYRGRFFPTPKELVEAVRGSAEARSAEELIAGLEWLERVMAGSRYGSAPPRARRTLDLMGGSEHLRLTATSDIHFRRREFERLWGHVERAERRDETTLPPMTEAGRRLLADATPARLRS
jgi:hypothetical protein